MNIDNIAKENKRQTAEHTTKEFFKRRFPEKDIEFEKKGGYFWEWVDGFEKGTFRYYMDEKSLNVWLKMEQEGYRA